MQKKNVPAEVADKVNEVSLTDESLCNKIHVVRGCQIILDRDIADLYGVETKRINEQVKRNANRFPEEFMIRLNRTEFDELVANCDRLELLKHSSSLPFAFTEQGVAMLSSVLKSDNAVRVSIAIMKAFVAMRHFLMDNQSLLGAKGIYQLALQTNRNSQKIDKLERDVKSVMEYFHDPSTYKHHLILNGQKFEADIAYTQIYGMAQKSIFVIDNYVGVKTLDLLRGVAQDVKVTIFSDQRGGSSLTPTMIADFNAVRPDVVIDPKSACGKFHDRYIVLDYETKNEKMFHCGASSKDAGGKITTITQLECPEVYHPLIDCML